MAKKEKKAKEKKIIREFMETRFKEITPEAETEELEIEKSELEEDIEPQAEEESFVEFSTRERAAQILEAKPSVQETRLETELESVPSPAKKEPASTQFYTTGKYETSYSTKEYEPFKEDRETPSLALFSAEQKEMQERFLRKQPPAWREPQEIEIRETPQREERRYEAIEKKKEVEKKAQAKRRMIG